MSNPDLQSKATLLFPHFAAGGGWTTEFVLVNPSDDTISGSLLADGEPAQRYSIPPRSSARFSTPTPTPQVRIGSAQVIADETAVAPDGVAIFSLNSNGITVTAAGTPALLSGSAFRMYVETNGALRSGIAITNAEDTEVRVHLELMPLDGAGRLAAFLTIPAFGHRAMFLNELPGLASISAPFQGVLRISSANQAGIGVLGLRGHTNARGDFLIATTPPINENSLPAKSLVFPHVVDGGGYTTHFALFSGSDREPRSGYLKLFSQKGSDLNVGFD